ncbi:hypothetical protein BH09MYX1_BH09MYX1_55050 [soil metagenome]
MSSRSLRTRSKYAKLLADSRGATMVEYAVLLALILVIASAVYKTVGKKVRMAGDQTAGSF